jgi:hypothetical protein
MHVKRLFFAVVLTTILFSVIARADYVEVRRAANVRVDPNGDADTALRAELGTNLHLVESETQNGYYHVEDPQTGTQGWIYRSLVRRFPGNIPQPGATSASFHSTLGVPFPLNRCKIPYNETPQKKLSIESCGLQGNAGDNTGEAGQNPQKNDLCITGAAQPISISDLAQLQQEVDDSGMKYGNKRRGKSGPPLDRTPLTTLPPVGDSLQLGEGSLVTFVGYLSEAHYSPESASKDGESVNCGRSKHEEADIHVALGSKPGRIKKKDPDRLERLCKSISAEFIPHARPDVWDVSTLNQVSDLERPVRVTGHLFFDGSHEPCRNGKPLGTEPRRISSWEIHPVYTFEVCKFDDIKKCSATSKAAWQPISNADGIDLSEDDVEEP